MKVLAQVPVGRRQGTAVAPARRVVPPRGDDSTFVSVFRKLEADPGTYFQARWVRCEPQFVQSSPSSSVLRFAACTPERQYVLYLKVFKPRSSEPQDLRRQLAYLETEFRRTLQARDAFAGASSLAVARPVACFPEDLAMVTEAAEGVGLSVVLHRVAIYRTRAARSAALIAVRRCGEWLRHFQAGVAADTGQRRDHRKYLNNRLVKLLDREALAADEYREILDAFDREWAHVSPADLEPVAAHCDLCPANILVAPDRLTVLDFAASLDRARYLDVAHLSMHLSIGAQHLRLDRGFADELQRTLLASFEPGLHAGVPLFKLMLLQNVVTRYLKLATMEAGGLRRVLHHRRARHAKRWLLGIVRGLAASAYFVAD